MRPKVTQVHGTEIDVLRAVEELGVVDPIAVAHHLKFGSAYADYLCRYLAKYGFLERIGRRYSLTTQGEKILEARRD